MASHLLMLVSSGRRALCRFIRCIWNWAIFALSRWCAHILGKLGCSTSLIIHPWSLWEENSVNVVIACMLYKKKQLDVLEFFNIYEKMCQKLFIMAFKMHIMYGTNLGFGYHVTQKACIFLCSSRCRWSASILYARQWRKRHPLIIKPLALSAGQNLKELFRIWSWEGNKNRH